MPYTLLSPPFVRFQAESHVPTGHRAATCPSRLRAICSQGMGGGGEREEKVSWMCAVLVEAIISAHLPVAPKTPFYERELAWRKAHIKKWGQSRWT